jgi:hypothetical protein
MDESLTNNRKPQKRYVMLIEDELVKNLSTATSQTEFAEYGLSQVSSTFEKFVC